MKIETRAEIEIPHPPDVVFDAAVACESFPKILRPFGPIPGVTETEMIGVASPQPGARRRVVLTDGSTMQEELLAVDRPRRHTYRWVEPPRGPLSFLVRSATGDWVFAPSAGGTRITWTYTFELTSPLAYLPGLLIVQLFRRWMVRGLDALRALLAA